MKKYNYDKYFSIVNARKEEEITLWLVLLYDKYKLSVTALPESRFITELEPEYEKAIETSKKHLNSFKISFKPSISVSLYENATEITSAVYVPLLSTRRGWKWNRKQILDCLKKYPNATFYSLNMYVGSSHSQMLYFRNIFGKHFRCFLEEVSKITTEIAGIKYRAADCTVKKVTTRDEQDTNTAYFESKEFRRLSATDDMEYRDRLRLSYS